MSVLEYIDVTDTLDSWDDWGPLETGTEIV